MGGDLKNKFVYQLTIAATQVLVPMLSYPYITRVLGPANLGSINYIDFLSQAFTIFAAFGIPWYAVREVSTVRGDQTLRNKLVSELALLNVIFSLVAVCFFIAFSWRQWQENPVLFLLAALNILFSAFTYEWYLQGMEAFRFTAIRSLLIRLGMILAFFLLVKTSADSTIYYGIFTVTLLLIAILNSYKLYSENRISLKGLQLKKHLQPLWHFFLTSSAISIYIYFDTIILEQLTHDHEAVGYYTLTLKMVKIFLLIILAIGTVLMPRLSWLASTGDSTAMKRHLDQLMNFIWLLGIPVGIGLILLAPEIVRSIAGEKFLPAVPLVRILSFLPLVIGLSNLFCFQTLVPLNNEKSFLGTVIAGCILSILLNFLLIPHLKEQGAAIANISTELLISILSGWYAHKLVSFKVSATVIVKNVGASLLFIPVVIVCRQLPLSAISTLLIAIPACVAIYFVMQYYIFKNFAVMEIKTYLLQLIKR